jgi:hypothetical protein
MVPDLKDGETVLTGLLPDGSAVFGVLAQIEALGLDLLELRQTQIRSELDEGREHDTKTQKEI